MKKHALMTFLFAGSVISLAATAVAQPQADAPAATRGAATGRDAAEARGTVRVTVDPAISSLSLSTAQSLCRAEGILAAAANMARLDPNRCKVTATPKIEETAQEGGGMPSAAVLGVRVDVKVEPGTQQEAQTLLMAACGHLSILFHRWGEEEKDRVKDGLPLLARQQRRIERDLRLLRKEMRERLRPLGYASAEDFSKAVQALKVEVDALELTAACEAERRRQLMTKISQIGEISAEAGKRDALTAELEKIATLREQALKEAEKLAGEGKSAPSQVREFQEKLALARAELLRRREEVARANGGEQLADLTRQLTAVELSGGETGLRLKTITDRYKEVLPRLKEIEDFQKSVEQSERGIQEGSVLEADWSRLIREGAPVVVKVPPLPSGPSPSRAPASRPAK